VLTTCNVQQGQNVLPVCAYV